MQFFVFAGQPQIDGIAPTPEELRGNDLWAFAVISRESNLHLSCHDVDLRLSEYLESDADLPPAERAAIEVHLETCAACSQRFESDRETLLFIRGHWEDFGSHLEVAADNTAVRSSGGQTVTGELDLKGVWKGIQSRLSQPADSGAINRPMRFRVSGPAIRFATAASVAIVLLLMWWIHGSRSAGVSSPLANTDTKRPADIHAGVRGATSPDVSQAMGDFARLAQRKVDFRTLRLADWEKHNTDMIARQFPWIDVLQKALQEKGVACRPIDLLMFGGDIWQFQYEPGESLDRPLAVFHDETLQRLARHYGVDGEWLKGEVRAYASNSGSADKTQGGGLARWTDELIEAAKQPSGVSTNLVLSSIRGGTYLTCTRSGAFLWAREHEDQFQKLLSDSSYRQAAGVPDSADANGRMGVLAQQVAAAETITQISEELLLLSAEDRCTSVTARAQQLRQATDVFVHSPVPEAKEGRK